MSDLLLMRGGGLRSLLSTPGLVACYLPYLDVVGRNVSQYTTQPVGVVNLTRSEATYLETENTSYHLCYIDKTATTFPYSYRVKITPIGRKRFLLGHGTRNTWALFDTSSVSVITTGSDATDARITANGDGTFDLSTGILSGYEYPALYTMPDDATSPENRSFAGDTSKGFTLHQWQVNLGTTLYPYSAPERLPQTVVDRSGNGNHAQLGSTAGADTNDPSWGTNALTFDGDDYCVTPDLGIGDLTAFTVFYITGLGAPELVGLWSRNNIAAYYNGSFTSPWVRLNRTAGAASYQGTPTTMTADKWYILSVRLTASTGNLAVACDGIGTFDAKGAMSTSTSYGDLLGAYTSNAYMYGNIAFHAMFNRVLGDNEASRVRANIVSLMNGQGVSLA